MFCEERHAAYDRVHLSEYFAGRSAESLSLVDGDFFAQYGIELRLEASLSPALTVKARLVRDAAGHETHWDKLVLATGSYPFVPPVPGHLAGCFVYRTLDDPEQIAARAVNARRGVLSAAACLALKRPMR